MRCMFCTKRVGLEIMTRDEYRAADKRCSSLMREATTGSVYVVTFVSSAIVGYVFVAAWGDHWQCLHGDFLFHLL